MSLDRKLYLVVTTSCNEKCKNCSFAPVMEHYKNYKFNTSLFEKIDYRGYDSVHIIGGEPGLLPTVDKAYLSNRLKDVHVLKFLYTNGTNLLEWNVAEYIIKYHITSFTKAPVIGNFDYDIVIHDNTKADDVIDFIQKNRNIVCRIRQDNIEPSDNYFVIREKLIRQNIQCKFDYLENDVQVKSPTVHKLFNRFNKCESKDSECYQSFVNRFKKCKCDWVLCCSPEQNI